MAPARTGAVIATFRTDEFGIPTTSTGSAGSPFRYTGEPLDASGLSYLRARYYDPSIGRFMSRDPFAGFTSGPLSLNRYSYVHNNPATWTDPSGQFLPLLVIGAAALVGAFAGGIAYTGGVAIANAAQGKPIGDGWNLVDLGISAVAGATSGVVATTGIGLAGLVGVNAIIGFDASLASMVAGGRRDPRELIAGTAFGALGPLFPGGQGATGFLRGVVSSSVANAGQSILASDTQRSGGQALVPKSRVLAGTR